MGMNAPRDQQRAPQPDVFWRRRVVALALGIAILGLLAWAVSGVVGGSTVTGQTADVGHVTKSGAARAGPPATASGGRATAQASARGTPSARSHTPGPTQSPAPTHKAVTTAHNGDSCPAGDVVISLMAAQDSYGAQVPPQFEIAIVSTAAKTCTFDVGAKSVQLVIKSGSARVWGSSDCPAGAGSQIAELARGVPAVLRISWDRKTSVPGCRLARAPALPGTYTATAYSGQLSSATMVFVLRGAGVAVP
jgi:hypothetical protein